jgi:hypothetical protein
MTRLIMAVLTLALAVYSYFEIQVSMPLVTARIATHAGASAPLGPLLSTDLHICFFLQLLFIAVLLGVPYVAPESIHFGTWHLGRYAPEQRYRILPSLRVLMGLLALLSSFYCSARIYFVVHETSSRGALLPADWYGSVVRAELEWLAGLALVCGLIIYGFIGKFEKIAGKE